MMPLILEDCNRFIRTSTVMSDVCFTVLRKMIAQDQSTATKCVKKEMFRRLNRGVHI